MYRKLSIITLVVLQLLNTAAGFDFGLWRRQDIVASGSSSSSSSPSPSPAPSPSPSNPSNSTSSPSSPSSNSSDSASAITNALNQDGIPSLCDQECIPAYNTTMTCQEVACKCNDDYEKSLFDCFLCAGNVLHAKFDTVQSKIDEINEACFQAGFNLTKLTFPGENSSRIIIPTPSSVSFTLALPTKTATGTQDVGSHPQPTQGTADDNSPGQPSPSATTTNGSMKNVVTGVFVSFGLVLMGSLILG